MLTLAEIERKSGLEPQTFGQHFLRARKPVVLTDLMDSWPAKQKWTVEFFKENYGHLEVPLYSDKTSQSGKHYLRPDLKLPFSEYLDMLIAGPTEYRMFLWNIFRHAPELCSDFRLPEIMSGFLKDFPMMFFGGAGSHVALHYDIDLSHVFLNQFFGRKRVVLFGPEQSRYIYRHPYTVASYIDVNSPDYERYPALRNVQGLQAILYPGETLFIPSGYWHYIEYLDGGYSISLRANNSYSLRARGLWNIATHYVVDRGMNQILGEHWRRMKVRVADRRARELREV